MIYLDHHAATPLSLRARQVMTDAEAQGWANPASVHRAGQRARAVLETARGHIAAAVGATAADVVLTSGGTEAVNLSVLGLGASIERVVTTGIGHPALAEAVAALGLETSRLSTPRGVAPDCIRHRSDQRLSVEPTRFASVDWLSPA